MPEKKKVTVAARVAWLFYAIVARLNAYYQDLEGLTWSIGDWMEDFVKAVLKVVGTGYPWMELDEEDDYLYANEQEMQAVFDKHKKQGDGNPANSFNMKEWVVDKLTGEILEDMNRAYYPDGDGTIRLGKVMYLCAKYYAKVSDDYKKTRPLVEDAGAATDEADADAQTSASE